MSIKPILFEDGVLKMIDQRLLPTEEVWLDYRDYNAVAEAIKTMVVRGAPAIGVAAAFGAALAFLAARFLFRDAVQRRFARQLGAINRGIERDGVYYLFLMRLIPAFPFFVINLVMGLTPMRTRTYFLVSLVGMIPGNLLFVNAGVQLGRVHQLRDFLSPALIGSLVAIGVFPLAVKKSVDFWRRRHRAV